MDQHPIPQDVTGFQFKLIGTMTVKQFGYVASGVIMAVIMWYLPVSGFFWILAKVVLIPLFGGSGVLIAFVPIEGRPIDVMATNFFKAVISPNQYVYRKQGKKFSFSTINIAKPDTTASAAEQAAQGKHITVKQRELEQKEAKLQAFLQTSQNEAKTDLDKKELLKLKTLALPAAPRPSATAASPVTAATPPKTSSETPLVHQVLKPAIAKPNILTAVHPTTAAPASTASVSQQPTKQEQTLIQQESALQHELQSAKQEETTTHTPASHQKVMTLEKQMKEIQEQKQRLEEELHKLKSQLNNQLQPPAQSIQTVTHGPIPMAAPSAMTTSPAPVQSVPAPISAAPAAIPVANPTTAIPASQYAKTLTRPATPLKADVPKVSDTPNVVCGIVKDPRGNILPNMLVEVKDKDGNPVRAFKTNPLGQFASATPLAKGVYTIELDDPKKQHTFDVIQITASGQIMLPIEIISHDAREALRQQLFN